MKAWRTVKKIDSDGFGTSGFENLAGDSTKINFRRIKALAMHYLGYSWKEYGLSQMRDILAELEEIINILSGKGAEQRAGESE